MMLVSVKRLIINHVTDYRYSEAVHLNEHRLLLRPREGRQVKLISHSVKVTPEAELFFAEDVFGNDVAIATLAKKARSLRVEATTEVELSAVPWPVYRIDLPATHYPFEYTEFEKAALGAHISSDSDSGSLTQWARSFLHGRSMDTLTLLQAINSGIHNQITYEARDAEGTQSAVDTLALGLGSCRDFAVLFTKAAAALGFRTRLVSGYLVPEALGLLGSGEGGTTHAWGEVYLPGAGWVAFDPTNEQMGRLNRAVRRKLLHARQHRLALIAAPFRQGMAMIGDIPTVRARDIDHAVMGGADGRPVFLKDDKAVVWRFYRSERGIRHAPSDAIVRAARIVD